MEQSLILAAAVTVTLLVGIPFARAEGDWGDQRRAWHHEHEWHRDREWRGDGWRGDDWRGEGWRVRPWAYYAPPPPYYAPP